MAYTMEKTHVMSSDKVHELAVRIYRPEGEVRGLFQIVHGMQEYLGRYEAFMTFLAENGFIVFGHDHLGHGETVKNPDEFGFFASRDGWKTVVEDVHSVYEAVAGQYPGKKTVLMGHSMGSFIVRLAASRYASSYSGLIVMGTGGPNPMAGLGIALAKTIKIIKGEKHVSSLIEKMAFGTYCKHCPEEAPLGWLTRVPEVRAKYAKDPFCAYHFTVSGLADLVTLNKKCNESTWFSAMAQTNLPVFLVSGSEDPVGDYGKGIKAVESGLKKAGVSDLTCKLYAGARHEILNEICAEEVREDLLSWANNHIA